jgi:hypothetical protein
MGLLLTSGFFSWISQTVSGPHPDGPNQLLELTPTSCMFFWLCMTLPWKWRRFVVFCDNYFSNVPLFRALLVYGIAACGTARPNSAGHPKVLKQVEKKRVTWRVGRWLGKLLRFSEQSGRIKRSYVFSRRPSIFLPTWGTLLRFYVRRRPRLPKRDSAYRKFIESVWGDKARQMQSQQKAAVEYNLFMGGVDMADQRYASFFVLFLIIIIRA